jgi:hypothetical protein
VDSINLAKKRFRSKAIICVSVCLFICIFYLFVYGLYNDAVINSDFIQQNDRMIREKHSGRDVEGSAHGILLF